MQQTAPGTAGRRGSNLPRVGDYNQVVVLEAIRHRPEGLSRVEIALQTGLSAQAVSNICRRLLQSGLVVEAGKQVGGPGKPRTLLQLSPERCYAVGLHLDPAVATVVLLDLLGHVVARGYHPLTAGAPPDDVLAALASDVDALITTSGVERSRIAGLGIAAPGPVDNRAGAVVDPPNLPGWHRVLVRDAVAAATGLPVLLDKDVVAAAVAEVWAGGVGVSGNAAFLYLGTGTGAGLVLRGEVYRGPSGNAGEVRHLGAGHGTSSAWSGDLSELASPAHLVREARRAGLPCAGAADEPVTAAFAGVCALARAGHPEAVELVDGLAQRVAQAATQLVDLLDLEQVVFGGPLWPHLRDPLLRAVPPVVAASAAARDIHPVEVRGTLLGDDVAAVGAGCLVLEDAFTPRSATLLLQR